MRASGTFEVSDFQQVEVVVPARVSTALPVGVSTMVKRYAGGVVGRSSTIFTAAFDPATSIGSYVAMESFEGAVGEMQGTFNFVHSAHTTGADRTSEFFAIVEGSGTGDFEQIRGVGGITSDADGHRVWFDLQTS
jgi:Protein of unknown function (DUF3224)